MSDCISLRISAIINDLFDGNKSEFARTVGVSESAVRSYIANTTPKADVLEKIASKTAISCEWLLRGRGDMCRVEDAVNTPTIKSIDERLFSLLKEKDAKIEEQARLIGRLEAEIEMSNKKRDTSTDVEDATCVAAVG